MATVLLVALALSAFVSLFFCWCYTSNIVEFRRMNGQIAVMQNMHDRTQGLLNDTAEYSTRNPKMAAILESMKLRIQTNTVPRPAGK